MKIKIKNNVYLLFLIVVGFFNYYPSLDTVSYISEGDTGRDLYAYEMTLEGKTPYRDFFYNYGPLMPYYYALCFKVFGIKISSALWGRMFLNIISGFLVYGCLRLYFQPIFAILATWWFWSFNQDFTFTFNHTGGVCLLLLIMYGLMRRLVKPTPWTTYLISTALFLLLLVKVNIGMAALLGTGISYMIINKYYSKVKFDSLVIVLVVPFILAFLVYLFILRNLQSYFIFQSLPFMPGMEYSRTSPIETIRIFLHLIWSYAVGTPSMDKTSLFLHPWPFQLMLILGLYSLISVMSSWFNKDKTGENRLGKNTLLMMAIFILLMTHEFLISAIDYRIWWCSSLAFLALFFLVGFMLQGKPRLFRMGMAGLVLIMIMYEADGKYLYRETIRREPQQYLSLERAKVYINNRPEWIDTVERTTQRIQELVGKNETFVILPYNPLYYFLTDHASPIPELAFYAGQQIGRGQEKRIIADLERKNNQWILLSNRVFSQEPNLGTFGINYCPLLAQYVAENFTEVESIGDWGKPAGWITNNAIKIFRKKNSRTAP